MAGIDSRYRGGLGTDSKAAKKPHIEWAFEEEQRAALELLRSAGESLQELRGIDEQHKTVRDEVPRTVRRL
jgi:hypothetical protein